MCRTFAQVLTLIAFVTSLGCGRAAPPTPAAAPEQAPDDVTTAAAPADNSRPDKATAPIGFDSPDAAFATLQEALRTKDWRTAAGCMTDDSQQAMSTALLFAGGLMAAFGGDQAADLTAVMEKHGVDAPAPAFNFSVSPPGESPESESEPQPDPAATLPDIKDKAGFIGDMLAVLERMDHGQSVPKHERWAAAALGEVAIDGDEATASIVIQDDEGEKTQPIAFRKGDGGWLIHLSESDFGMGPGGPGDGLSAIAEPDTPPAGPLNETVLEGGLTSTLSLSFEQPFTSQFFGQEFPERTVFATLNLTGEPILNAYEYGEFKVAAVTDDTGATLELAAPVKDQFDAEFGEAFVELNDFFLDRKDTLPIIFALTPPAEGAKSITIEGTCKLKVRESLVVKDVLQSLGGDLNDERLAKVGTFAVRKPTADEGEPDKGLILEVKAPEGTVEGVKLLDANGAPLDSSTGKYSFGFGSERTFGLNSSEDLPADLQLRIILGGTEAIQVVPLKFEGVELP